MKVGYRGTNSFEKERLENADPTPSKNVNPAVESMKEMLRRVHDRDVDFEFADILGEIPHLKRGRYMKDNKVYVSQIGVCDAYIFENSIMNKSPSSQ